VIYAYRDEILEGENIGEEARSQVADALERTVDQYTAGDFVEDWDLDGLFTAIGQFFPLDLDEGELTSGGVERNVLVERIVTAGIQCYHAREEALGEKLMGSLERFLLLQTIDERWREHLFDMDYLREGIHLRGIAQIDPLVAYKNEAFTLFGDLMDSVWTDYARMIFNVQVNVEDGSRPGLVAPKRGGRIVYSADGVGRSPALEAAASAAGLSRAQARASRPLSGGLV